jgi:hypothetical protein
MGQCDEILKQGVFDTVIVDASRSVSDNILEWLKTSEYESFKNKTSAGLKVGFPIEGIPIEIGGDFSEDDFKEWKKAVDEGRVRNFTENESLEIVRRTASPVILSTWLECIRTTNAVGTGIVCSLLSDINAETILYKVQFIPNSSVDADAIPKIQSFIVTGSISTQGINVGDEVPFSGIVATIARNGKSEITINLNTEKGNCTRIVPAIPEPPPPDPPVVNIAGTYKSQENNRYIFEQDGVSVTLREVEPSDRVIASGAGKITGRTVDLTYQSLISDEKGTARITLSSDGQRVTGIYTRADTGETFALDWVRI